MRCLVGCCYFGAHMGTAELPLAYKDKKLGKWVQHQRSFANKGTLLPFRKRRLEIRRYLSYDTDSDLDNP